MGQGRINRKGGRGEGKKRKRKRKGEGRKREMVSSKLW